MKIDVVVAIRPVSNFVADAQGSHRRDLVVDLEELPLHDTCLGVIIDARNYMAGLPFLPMVANPSV